MKRIEIKENNLNMVYEITDENEIKLLHFSNLPFDENDINSCEGTASFRPVEVLLSGLNRPGERHGTKYTYTAPGYRLKYKDMKDYRNETGRKLEILMEDKPTGLEVCSNIQFYDGISVIRSWTELKNNGEEDLGVEYVSSFALLGIDKEGLLSTDEKLEVLIARNAWQKELIWNRFSMDQLGMSISQPDKVRRSSQTISVGNTGNWSTKNYLPMGCLKNKETDSILFWQIEQNGSWYWEISDQDGHMYLQLSGPTEHQSHWWKNLKPGDTFASVPVSVGSACGDVEEAAGELTKYRRAIRRKNEDNEKLPVIFNDYMNCLWGDPTTEKELPLIDKAKEAGCEYFCVDCGWYSAGFWWDGVGEWLPSKERFPGGLKEVMDYIRSKGMVPGVWLELEVMGIKCPKADKVPDDWYFMRHGKKVYDRSRYQLDFRNPEVIAHATEVIDRLVNEYGVGYIKMDYFYDEHSYTEKDIRNMWGIPENRDANGYKKVIIAPHFSVGDTNVLSFSTFDKNMYFYIYLAKKYKDSISFVFKPHPNLRNGLVKHGYMKSIDEYEAYLDEFRRLPNARVQEEGSYLELFDTSDAMIDDSISFVGEYLYTGKPMLFLERPEQRFNELGKKIIDAHYKVKGTDYYGIDTFLEDVVLAGNDTRKAIRQRVYEEELDYAGINGIKASDYIYNDIANALLG